MTDRRPTAELQVLREYLGPVEDAAVLREFTAALLCCFDGPPELQTLGRHVLSIVTAAHWDGDEPIYLPTFSRLIEQADRWLAFCDELQVVTSKEELRKAVSRVVAFVDDVFGRHCRYRLYAVDVSHAKYLGLVALRMPKEFTGNFEAGFQVDVFEPPYEVVADTLSYSLTAQRVEQDLPAGTSDEERSWYLGQLGLGAVPVTFTWHFSRSGLAKYETVKAAAESEGAPSWYALSLDFGHDAQDRPSMPQLRLVEALLTIISPSLAEGIDRVVLVPSTSPEAPRRLSSPDAAIQAHPLGSAAATTDQPAATFRVRRDTTIAPELPLQEFAAPIVRHGTNAAHGIGGYAHPSPAVPPTGDSPAWFAASDCIPGEEPWFFAGSDPRARAVAEIWESFREPRQPPGSVLLCAPTGCGKDLVARSFTGLLARGGKFFRLSIQGEEKDLEIELLGVVKEAYTDVSEATSKIQLAGSGAVLLDEFPGWLLHHPNSDFRLRSNIDSLRTGKPVHAVGGAERKYKPWFNSALLVFAGPPEEVDPFLKRFHHWPERVDPVVRMPAWSEFSAESRACIFRWLLLKHMAPARIERVFVHRKVFDGVVVEPTQRLINGNARAVHNLITPVTRVTVQSEEADAITLEVRASVSAATWDSIDVQRVSADSLRGTPEWLSLGVGSEFDTENWLGSGLSLVRNVAGCAVDSHGSGNGCASSKLKVAIRYDEDKQEAAISADDLLDLHYLLLAAVREVQPESQEADPYRTSTERLTHHFGSRNVYNVPFKSLFDGATAGTFRIPSATAEKTQFLHGARFRDHVFTNARRLQQQVERIACAFPRYFHRVPFWEWNQLPGTTYGEANEQSESGAGQARRSPRATRRQGG